MSKISLYRAKNAQIQQFRAGEWRFLSFLGTPEAAQSTANFLNSGVRLGIKSAQKNEIPVELTQVSAENGVEWLDLQTEIAASEAGIKASNNPYPKFRRTSAEEDETAYRAAYDAVMEVTGDEEKARLAGIGAIRRISVGLSLKSYKSAEGAEGYSVRGWGITFGSPEARDTDRDYFDDTTEFMIPFYPNSPLFFNHAMKSALGNYGLRPIGNRTDAQKVGKIGVWMEHALDTGHPFIEKTLGYVERGILSYSTDTNPMWMNTGFNKETGHRKVWPLIGASLVPLPAEPGNSFVVLG